MTEGWVKLHRSIRENPVYSSSSGLMVWIECLLSASHNRYKIYRGGKEYTLKPGEFAFGRHSWAKRLGMPPSTIRNWTGRLTEYGMIQDTCKDSLVPTIYRIVKWKEYQSKDRSEDKLRTGGGQVKDTTKNVRMKELNTHIKELADKKKMN